MEAAEERLRALGCAKINLQVRDDNEAARAFYEAIGYRLEPDRQLRQAAHQRRVAVADGGEEPRGSWPRVGLSGVKTQALLAGAWCRP